MEAYFELTPSDAALLRNDLEQTLSAWKREHWTLKLERRSLERMLRTQKKRPFRASKHRAKFKTAEGRTVEIDAGDGMLQRTVQRLGEIETRMETLEYQIEDAEEELIELPASEEEDADAETTK